MTVLKGDYWSRSRWCR